MADWLTKGRVIFGVGRGYHTREVETLGGPLIDKEANRDIFEEQVDIMFKAFNQAEFSHKGKYYELPPKLPYRGYELSELTLVPRPWKLPVECWQPVVSAQDRGLDFMIKHGIKGIVGGGSALMAEGNIHAFQRAHERAGIETKLGENLCLGITYHLAPTREQAIREATPYYEEHAKMFGPLGFLGPLKPEQIEAIGRRGGIRSSGIPTLEEAFEAGSWYCGPPEGFVEFLQQAEEKFPGLEIVNVQSAMGTPEAVILEQLEWFAGDVMSKVNRAQAAD
jgi:alkanesulfonate monooxygenase SsuD/methylene tetrahydromethanopterin reductase-like flavin-dependent oxidoreductase (luciferase family)